LLACPLLFSLPESYNTIVTEIETLSDEILYDETVIAIGNRKEIILSVDNKIINYCNTNDNF